MSAVSQKAVPKYCRQREKGRPDRACVWIDGKKISLGKYGSPESKERYAELIGTSKPETPPPSKEPSMAEIMVAYLEYAKGYYVKNGNVTNEYTMMRESLKFIRKSCSTLPASQFGPKRLKEIRQDMIAAGHSRKYINSNVDRVRRMFRWAAAEELIEPSIPQALAMVTGLRQGRTEAPDRPPVLPVDDATVDATLPYVPEIVGDMIRLQRATGMRPAELCMIRPCDLDRSGQVWLYRPESHKTEHHGHQRQVLIGPKGQEVLLRYLARDSQAYCFCPCDSEARRRAAQHEARQTPMNQGNRPGLNRADNPQRPAGNQYSTNAYRRAIHRACDKAFKAPKGMQGDELKAWKAAHRWSPNQLRHSAATEIRKQFGLEAAQVVLGHSRADVTQVYAERDLQKGLEVAAKIG